jgi:hypothetical protein
MMRAMGPADELEVVKVIRRYVTPDRRYLKLGGSLLSMSPRNRARFTRKLGKAASKISRRELDVLLNGGWRESKTAAWLIAVANRTEYREGIGQLLLASEAPYAGTAYCVALAAFGTPADADLLVAYLDRYLRCPDLDYDQRQVLGTLLLLDARLGAERAAPFLTQGGLWQQWTDGPPSNACDPPDTYSAFMSSLCAFVEESAEHCRVGR